MNWPGCRHSVCKVLSTSDDLAMALKCGSTRETRPGKGTVGIEVPNLNREIVYFRKSPNRLRSWNPTPLKVAAQTENLRDKSYQDAHLLIAGATVPENR
jgi:S-DNA-T family DNA segregation ATPase FtsK/SpoIIIE